MTATFAGLRPIFSALRKGNSYIVESRLRVRLERGEKARDLVIRASLGISNLLFPGRRSLGR